MSCGTQVSRIFETERLNLVLVDVREGDATTLNGFDTSKFLHILFKAKTGNYQLSDAPHNDGARRTHSLIPYKTRLQ